MTLDKAIEIKSRVGEEFLHTDPDKLDEAERLGIEALQRCQEIKNYTPKDTYCPLPGETED